MAAPMLSQQPPNASRPRRSLRWVAWLIGLALCGFLITLVTRSLLIRQMRLPRLTLDQRGHVTSVTVTPDGNYAFSGDDPTNDARRSRGNKPADVFVWDTSSGRLLRRLHGFYWRSEGVTASPDGRTILATGTAQPNDGPDPKSRYPSMMAWDWRSGQKLWASAGCIPLSCSPDGRLIGVVGELRNAHNGDLVRSVSSNAAADAQNGFSPDGRFFGYIGAGTIGKNGFTDSDNGDRLYYSTIRLHLWDVTAQKENQVLPSIRVRAFDFARDGQWLVMTSDTGLMAGGEDGSAVRRVDMRTGAIIWTRKRSMNEPDHDPEAVLTSIAVTPNGKHVVAQSTNDRLIVLDARTGQEEFRTLPRRSDGGFWSYPGGLAFSGDGRTLVSRCGSGVQVWDASSLQ